MYYRRYFEGKIESNTTKNVVLNSETFVTTQIASLEKSSVVGNAVAETLKDTGMNSYYDDENFILYFNRDEPGILFFVRNNDSLIMTALIVDETYVVAYGNYPSGTSPFNGFNYKFYAGLLGEPTALFGYGVGYWTSPKSIWNGSLWGIGENKKTGEKIHLWGYGTISSGNPIFYIRKTDGAIEPYAERKQIDFRTLQLLGFDNGVVLKEIFDTTGMYTIDNCYMGCKTISYGTENGFYSINGEEYYSPNKYLIVKCPSKISIRG